MYYNKPKYKKEQFIIEIEGRLNIHKPYRPYILIDILHALSQGLT